jgi:hypothetical protein
VYARRDVSLNSFRQANSSGTDQADCADASSRAQPFPRLGGGEREREREGGREGEGECVLDPPLSVFI